MAKTINILNIDLSLTILSSECTPYKTEAFALETARLTSCDIAVAKIAEAIVGLSPAERAALPAESGYMRVTFGQRAEYEFDIAIGSALPDYLKRKDIVFYKFGGEASENLRLNDRRLTSFLSGRESFTATLRQLPNEKVNFDKLYRILSSDKVNFPMLNKEQQSIVEAEDGNILVQGVAGSGKTNLCIDKIVFAASRGYVGKVLYSTYSRGLLVDTQTRVNIFRDNIERFVHEYKDGKIRFADANHKKAIENKLGIYFDVDEDDKIADKLRKTAEFLSTKVDYCLIEDLYSKYLGGKRVESGEEYFLKTFIPEFAAKRMEGILQKIKYLSYEVIYKEIYGFIYGRAYEDNPQKIMTREEYIALRSGTFSSQECDAMYRLAKEYSIHLTQRGLVDNNEMSRIMLAATNKLPLYSIAILDEVQDMTEINLLLMKRISRKLFAVGDALQMINPSYFSFAYLKRLMYSEDVVTIRELKHNYRNTRRIAEIVESLSDLNVSRFGTHNFVLRSRAIDTAAETSAVYVRDKGLVKMIADRKLDNYTLIVSGAETKERLRPIVGNREILTVSEVKGLERDTVILYNLLSDHKNKWAAIERASVNRKSADENSVYRYYFNLFYVGVSRAKAHIYVTESAAIPSFEEFFRANFVELDSREAVSRLGKILSSTEIDDEELVERIEEFMRLGQYDNARVALDRLRDDVTRTAYKDKIDVHEEFIRHGKYREAGIRFWEKGLHDNARNMFSLSGDKLLTEFMDACIGDDNSQLDYNIVKYFADVGANDVARNLIISTVENDLKDLKKNQSELNAALRALKEKHYG